MGLPDRMRVDNGHPWGFRNDLPRDLALWLIGLGVGMIWNRAACPQQNGKVERDQGVLQQWIEIKSCKDDIEVKVRLTRAAAIQRCEYPAVGGRTRVEAFPALMTPRRSYDPAREAELWSLDRVDRFLSGLVVHRRVSRGGQISLYHRNFMVGKTHQGQEVHVKFDPVGREWVILTFTGQEIRRHPAPEINQAAIVGLSVGYHRPSPGGAEDTDH